MKSTDHNINNPLQILELQDYSNYPNALIFPKVVECTQEVYDLMRIHDPHTIYTIVDSLARKQYLGDIFINEGLIISKYLLGINIHNEYIIYLDNFIPDTNRHQLSYISRYDDPQVAIKSLELFNKVGKHDKKGYNIYNTIINYINHEISIHDCIIGILSIFNFNTDPRIQELIKIGIQFNIKDIHDKLPNNYLNLIKKKSKTHYIYLLYSNLYDLVEKYYWFSNDKYQHDDLDLSKEINEIYSIMTNSNNFV